MKNITIEEALLLPDGAHHDLPIDIYHQLPYVGSSTLKKFAVNPSTCHDPVDGIPPVGEASHVYSLQGQELFHATYAIMPAFPCPIDQNPKGWKNTNRYKDLVDSFLSLCGGKIVLSSDDAAAVVAMDKSLRAHPVTRTIMNRGANELSIFWTDQETGLRCKARIDDYPGNGIANDYKTTNSLASFLGVFRRLRYELQSAWYTIALESCGAKIDAFIFCVAEFNAPYGVRTGRLGMPEGDQIDRLQAAKDEVRRILYLYKQCSDRGVFPAYEIPRHIFNIDQIQPHDLLEDWNGIGGRYI
jgi:hypothetical protein